MKPNILIVDDSPVMRRFIERVLDATSLEPGLRLKAENGQEALEVLSTLEASGDEIDLVLADINMPVMDGPALVRALREHETWKKLPVLVVSTDRSDDRLAEMQALGVAGYVTKPFTPWQLEEKIVAALSGEIRIEQYPASACSWAPPGVSWLNPGEMQQAVETAVGEVLEQMCFLSVDGSGTGDEAWAKSREDELLAARLVYSGPFGGSLEVMGDPIALRVMAANFLGEEEASTGEDDQAKVLLELANMICGAVLHQQDSARLFTLASPVLVKPAECLDGLPRMGPWQYFEVAGGRLMVGLHCVAANAGPPRTGGMPVEAHA